MIEVRLSALRGTKPQEYLVRFLFGGAATLLAGLVAHSFGSAAGGLFLAFPAIFPASVTLIESHEKERKGRLGCDGTRRGRIAASIDAAGAALGSIGLIGFAIILWRMLPTQNPWLVIPVATAVWFGIAFLLWELRKNRLFGRHSRHAAAHDPSAHGTR
jgi:MFS family permease